MIGWTQESTQHFRRLHATGKFSAQQIADELVRLGFTHITRNACVGKAHRMKLVNGRVSGTNINDTKNRDVKAKPRPIPVEPVEVMRPPIRNRTGLHNDLDHDQCRWPMGKGPPFIFCCEDNNGSSPYCPHHAARAFQVSR